MNLEAALSNFKHYYPNTYDVLEGCGNWLTTPRPLKEFLVYSPGLVFALITGLAMSLFETFKLPEKLPNN